MADSMPLRIVSLLPSATEIVYALGAGDELVGVSHECDHPPGRAAALGRAAAGETLLGGLRERLELVERRVAGAGRPGVVSIEWLDPVMLGGTWMPELIAVAGGNAYFNRSGPRLVDSAELLAACLHPDRFPDRRGRGGGAVRRVDAGLGVHPALP